MIKKKNRYESSPGIHVFNASVSEQDQHECQSVPSASKHRVLSRSDVFLAAGGSGDGVLGWRFPLRAGCCQHAASDYSQESSGPRDEDGGAELIPSERGVTVGQSREQFISAERTAGLMQMSGGQDELKPSILNKQAHLNVFGDTTLCWCTYLVLTGVKGL